MTTAALDASRLKEVKRFDLAVVGRAYTDIFSSVPQSFLARHGILPESFQHCPISRLDEIRRDLPSARLIPGGAGANTAATLAALGGKAGFFGKVYRDEVGEAFLDAFRLNDIALCCPPYGTNPKASALSLVLLTDGLHGYVFNAGCSADYGRADFEGFDFSSTRFLLVEASLIGSRTAGATIAWAVAKAKERTLVAVNLQGITQWEKLDTARMIAATASLIIGNQAEQAAFPGDTDLGAMERPAGQIVVTTKGVAGADAVQDGQNFHADAERPAGFGSAVGAGDAFAAGFILARAKGWAIPESLRLGARTAAAVIEETCGRTTKSLAHLLA